jgi:hypothetical protein
MIALTRHQRDILRAEVAVSLSGIEDLSMAFDEGKPCKYLKEMRRRYHDVLWLADDLGWELDDPRNTFTVTLPPERFAAWVEEGRVAAEDGLVSASEVLRDPWQEARHFRPPVPVDEVARGAREEVDRALDTINVSRDVLAAL